MRKYRFSVNNLPDKPAIVSNFFYYDSSFLEVHTRQKKDIFLIHDEKEKTIAGLAVFQRSGVEAISLLTAPFGSVCCNRPGHYQLFEEFIKYIISYYRSLKSGRIIIKHYPWFYDPGHSGLIEAALQFQGFHILKTDINHHLLVKEGKLYDSFNKMEKRKFNQYAKAITCRLASGREAGRLYEKLKWFRDQKGIPLNITRNIFNRSVKLNPGKYLLFEAYNEKNNLQAIAVMVRVTDSILYYFLPGSHPEASSSSPMLALLDYIYQYALKKSIRIIDLGISSVSNSPQKSLIRFKENIGGIPSVRYTFQLDLT